MTQPYHRYCTVDVTKRSDVVKGRLADRTDVVGYPWYGVNPILSNGSGIHKPEILRVITLFWTFYRRSDLQKSIYYVRQPSHNLTLLFTKRHLSCNLLLSDHVTLEQLEASAGSIFWAVFAILDVS